MDFHRLALVAALALVSVLLLTEWVKFSGAHTRPNGVPLGTTTHTLASAPQAAPENAVPMGTSPSEVPATTRQHDPSPTDPSRLITVTTDTLQLSIALQGGDIESAALPGYPANLDQPRSPFVLMEKSASALYTAQSGLVGPNGTDTEEKRPVFHASQGAYLLAPGADTLTVELTLDGESGDHIVKRFTLYRGQYTVTVDYLVDNAGSQPWQAALYGILRRDDRPDPGATGGSLGIKPFIGFATRTSDKPYLKHTFKDIQKEPYLGNALGGWVALVQHYFISAWIPDSNTTNRFEMLRSPSGLNVARFTSPITTVSPGAKGALSARFYAGPKDQHALAEISTGLDLTVDYGWLWWIAQPLFALLRFFATGELHAFGNSMHLGNGLGNWGFAIIFLTLLVKGAFFQLSATSYKSMAKMRKLQPKMLELRERYGDDRQKLSQETMELYKKEKVNPLGGCLPIFIQMPVFLSLYWVLLESIELRQAPFIGWIRDLSVMDPYFVLPLLMGASMFFQQRLNPPPPDPVQAKVFQFMPVVFTVFFLFFPAGLVLYWLVNNLLSITQQWVITAQIDKTA